MISFHIKSFILLGAILSCTTFLNARTVTEAETVQAATQWLRANPHILQVTGEATLTEVKSPSGALLLRKVSYPSGGALLIAGDTRLPPVVAVLPRGRISQTHPTMLHVKADVEARLKEFPVTDDPAWQALLSDPPVQPLAHPLYVFDATRWEGELDHWNQESFNRYSKWEEGTIYNRYTPEKYMVGCVAIAGSAIQQFYAFPSEQCAYTNNFCAVYGEDMRPQFRPLQTRPGAYDWNILPKQWQKTQALTEAQSELLARIAANSGVITGTHYAATASGGSTYFLMEGLRRGAGYATGMEYCPSNTTQMHDFLSNLLYAQLRCGAPCVLDLGGKAGNHAVTAVGLAEDHLGATYTRIFFGWGGSGDVWYALPTQGSFHGILGVGTFVSVDGSFLPIYGTLLNADDTPAANHPLAIAGQTTTTDANGRFAMRIKPMPNVTITAGETSTTLTLDDVLLRRAAVESWAMDNNPRAVSTDALLKALPKPITIQLSPQTN